MNNNDLVIGMTQKEMSNYLKKNERYSHYVYAHCYKNKITYIGVGSNNRVTDLSGRSNEYKKIIEKVGRENIRFIIIDFVNDKEEALFIERELHKYHCNLYSTSKRGNFNREILQIDPKTNGVINVWNGARYVEKELGWDHSSIIRCCNGERQSAYGYSWQYMIIPYWS